MASAIIVALAQQRIETLTEELDKLAEKIEVISIVLSEYNQALKAEAEAGASGL